jgi:hypothetical protein
VPNGSSVRPYDGPVFDLRRSEWLVVALVALVVVVVNKLVINDRGNTWPMLVLLAVAAGIGVVHLRAGATGHSRRSSH